MAQLDEAIPTTLGALVGAATFAAGFLSTRVHRQRDQALTIATETDALAGAASRAGEPIPPAVVRTQLRALDEAGNDRLDWMAGGSVVLLAGSVIVLAVVTARSAGTSWSSGEGELLIAFVVAALVVLTASMVDLVLTRRDVGRRRVVSIGGLMERSDRLWVGVGEVSQENLDEAVDTATVAVRSARGMYGPAWHLLGNAHLAQLGGPHPRSDTWLNARWALDRATTLGPESAGLRWARAYLLEIGPEPEWEECVREWVRGCWLHHEGTRPLARTDTVVEGPDERTYRAITVASGKVPAADTLRFRPHDPVVFAGALGRIPPFTAVARLTAQLLHDAVQRHYDAAATAAQAVVQRHHDAAATAAQAVVDWLEDLRHRAEPFGNAIATATAQSLLAPKDPPGWCQIIEHYLSQEGPPAQAQREADAAAEAAEAKRQARHEKTIQKLDARAAKQAEPSVDRQGSDDKPRRPDGEIDWDAWLAHIQEESAEREREHDEWLAKMEKRQAKRERTSRDLADSLASLKRFRSGRSPEADLAQEVDDLPEAPWPEPRPRPGEQPSKTTH